MTNSPAFEFTVDKAAKKVFIKRSFAAELSLVWAAFTTAELLDQWTAPAPWKARTKYMDFKVGGRRLYAMVGPEGQEMWAIQEYRSITPQTHFQMWNSFADKEGNPEMPGSDWDYQFSEADGSTMVSITIYNDSLERMERMLQLGFEQGFMATLQNLDLLLASKQ